MAHSPQVGISDKLGNCAELVGLAELVELVAPVPLAVVVAFADGSMPIMPSLPLTVDDDDDVDELASCDHTTDAKSCRRTKNKGMGRLKNLTFIIVLV